MIFELDTCTSAKPPLMPIKDANVEGRTIVNAEVVDAYLFIFLKSNAKVETLILVFFESKDKLGFLGSLSLGFKDGNLSVGPLLYFLLLRKFYK